MSLELNQVAELPVSCDRLHDVMPPSVSFLLGDDHPSGLFSHWPVTGQAAASCQPRPLFGFCSAPLPDIHAWCACPRLHQELQTCLQRTIVAASGQPQCLTTCTCGWTERTSPCCLSLCACTACEVKAARPQCRGLLPSGTYPSALLTCTAASSAGSPVWPPASSL